MIGSFGCKHTEKARRGEHTKKWNPQIANNALRKLFMIHSAQDIKDLIIPPSNQLHKLMGNLNDYYAIRINDQWRIIFKWQESKAIDVQIIDYH
jgi:toxin HigB-1